MAATADTANRFLANVETTLAAFFPNGAAVVESHQDGGLHVHALAVREEPTVISNVRFADVDDAHPNIRTITYQERAIDYLLKEDPKMYIGWGMFAGKPPSEWRGPSGPGRHRDDSAAVLGAAVLSSSIALLNAIESNPRYAVRAHGLARSHDVVLGMRATLRPPGPPRPVQLFWYFGDSGLGKTTLAYETDPEHQVLISVALPNNPRDTFWLVPTASQAEVLILDNVSVESLVPLTFLLKASNGRNDQFAVKGGFVALTSLKRIICTSILPPWILYESSWSTGELKRRLLAGRVLKFVGPQTTNLLTAADMP